MTPTDPSSEAAPHPYGHRVIEMSARKRLEARIVQLEAELQRLRGHGLTP